MNRLIETVHLSTHMFKLMDKIIITIFAQNDCIFAGLQIYGGPGPLPHDFKIWPITFQGSGPNGPIPFSCENNLTLIKMFILQRV